ncbi:hypothetical protein [Microbacterium sp. 22242]|uniref:hypothetical protein n=1 Tax=Microbacterium sp. 22242 TaxID=3453896 RepID=UPI003F86BB04
MNIDRNPRTRTSRLLMAVPAVVLAIGLAACSGGAARPSADKVADGVYKVLASSGVTKPMAKCFAEKLVDSKLSDETLNYIASGQDKQKNEADKALTTKVLEDNKTECLAAK